MSCLKSWHSIAAPSWTDAHALLSRRSWPETLEIVAELQLKDAQEFGLVLRKGSS